MMKQTYPMSLESGHEWMVQPLFQEIATYFQGLVKSKESSLTEAQITYVTGLMNSLAFLISEQSGMKHEWTVSTFEPERLAEMAYRAMGG